jgi:DNA-binding FrmR family transcriptional regulator
MKKNFKKQILNRMNYLSGHFDGIKEMLKNDKYCIDVIKQNEAVIAAIKKVNLMILANHLNTCVAEAIKGKNEKERKKKIKEILEIFKNCDKNDILINPSTEIK